jgi:hypothetical protein
VIRINLLQNRFGAASSKDSVDVDLLSGLTTTTMDAISSGKGKRIATIAGALVAIGILGGGAWYLFRTTPDTALVPETVTVEKPIPKAAAKDTTKSVKAAKKDSLKRDTVKVKENKPAPEPVAKPKLEPKPVPEAKKLEPAAQKPAEPTPPPSEYVSIQPAVVAPALAGGVVDLVLGETKSSGSHASTPSSFEDLSPLSRLAYQRFAFERILSVIRQVTPPDMRYTNIKILSPGIVTIQGSSKDPAGIASLVQGLLAQSMVDTALVKNANGQFALMARLPFSASFGGSEGGTDDFKKTITQVRDLASTQGLDLGKPSSPSLQTASGLQRARWSLSGTGAWEAVSKWIGALQSTQCPVGFTSLRLTSGPDGKLRLSADAISYGK